MANEGGSGQELTPNSVHFSNKEPFGEEVGCILVLRLLVPRCVNVELQLTWSKFTRRFSELISKKSSTHSLMMDTRRSYNVLLPRNLSRTFKGCTTGCSQRCRSELGLALSSVLRGRIAVSFDPSPDVRIQPACTC